MAAKRFFEESGSDPNQQNEKRRRTRPSLASAIEEVVKMNFFENFCSVLEPMLRRVVNEEIEHGLQRGMRSFSRSSSFRIQALEEPPTLQLKFPKKLSLPIFTGSRILDIDGNPLELILVDTKGNQIIESSISNPIKIEIVVVDGDFPYGDGEVWRSEEFERSIVRERKGKRPLLTGDVNVTMREGFAAIGEIEFTDNSSWIRSRKFRIAAKVVGGTTHQGFKIREAITEALVVKDHRGELYKKHHPPELEDDVWRLEKIGKEGAFHRKLASEGIRNVGDFLKLSIVDQPRLRKILGAGMSDKMWEVTLKHARTCILGNKLYISRGPNHCIILNPICQVVKAVINGHAYANRDLTSLNRAYIEKFVGEAYQNWDSLEEVDGLLSDVPQITQGTVPIDEYPAHDHSMAMRPYQDHHAFPSFQSNFQMAFTSTDNEHIGLVGNSTFIYGAVEDDHADHYNSFSESSSDGDLALTRSFIP